MLNAARKPKPSVASRLSVLRSDTDATISATHDVTEKKAAILEFQLAAAEADICQRNRELEERLVRYLNGRKP